MKHDFLAAVAVAMRDPGLAGLRPVVEKEILHYDILFALEREKLLNDIVFQGGTSLRLIHAAPRFSEDLDFVGGLDFTPAKLMKIRDCVMDHIGTRYGLQIAIKEPKEMRRDPLYYGIAVDRWQISVTTSPEQKDMPRQKIKLEVANVPAHTRELRSPRRNYAHIPDGYDDIMIPVETIDEILADKVVSLVACTTHPRHRDIWDLQWLRQRNARLIPELVVAKIADYRIEDYRGKLDSRIEGLPDLVASQTFRSEMSRFVAPDVRARTFDKPGFTEFLAREVAAILIEARSEIFETRHDAEFAL